MQPYIILIYMSVYNLKTIYIYIVYTNYSIINGKKVYKGQEFYQYRKNLKKTTDTRI